MQCGRVGSRQLYRESFFRMEKGLFLCVQDLWTEAEKQGHKIYPKSVIRTLCCYKPAVITLFVHGSASFGILIKSASRRSPLRLLCPLYQSAQNKHYHDIKSNDRFGFMRTYGDRITILSSLSSYPFPEQLFSCKSLQIHFLFLSLHQIIE